MDGGVHTTTIKPKTVVNNCWITFRVIWWMIETLTANQNLSTKPYSTKICLQPDIYSTTSKPANIIFILETEWWHIDLFIFIYFIVVLLLSHHRLKRCKLEQNDTHRWLRERERWWSFQQHSSYIIHNFITVICYTTY